MQKNHFKKTKETKKMKTAEIKFEVSEEILNSLNQNVEEFTDQLRLYSALQLFKQHKLSFGQAAELAAMTRERFLIELDKNEIDIINYDPSELNKELKRLA